jgi:hypothetical protein
MVKVSHGKIQTHPELADVVNHSLYDKTNPLFNMGDGNGIRICLWYCMVSY